MGPRLPCWALALCLLGLACGLQGCSEREVVAAPPAAAALPPMLVERSLLGLLHKGTREVLEECSDDPIRVGPIAPNPNARTDSGVLPALVMVPAAAVRITVPPTVPEARLQLAAGVDESAASGAEGLVRFTIELDGRLVFDESVLTGPRTQNQARAWRRAELPIGSGGELLLRTAWIGPPDQAPLAGFGLLDIRAEEQIPRTLASAEHPNVLVILIDTLRADALSTYGYPEPVSPNIDALAQRGTKFERVIATAPWTWPSTASIFTGLGAVEHGVTNRDSCHLAEELETLAEALQNAGLSSAAMVTNPLVAATRNFDQGFESYWERKWATGEEAVDAGLSWLEHNRDRRFFLYLHLTDPHHPYQPSQEMRERFAADVPLDYDDNELRALWKSSQFGKPVDMDRLFTLGRQAHKLYESEVAMADHAVGRMLDYLAQTGLDSNTLVVVTADHGEEFFEHEMLAHGNQFHEESLRVPLILAGPGVQAGKQVPGTVELRLLAPTILSLAHVRGQANLDQAGLLERGPIRQGEPLYFGSEFGRWPGLGPRELQGLELDGQRLTWAPAMSDLPDLMSLYDLKRDPSAKIDFSSERPDEVARLRALLEAWVQHGAAVQPQGIGADAATTQMLKDIGYIGDD